MSERRPSRRAPSERRLSGRGVIAVALTVVLVVFAIRNSQSVTIHWLVTTTETPLIIILAGCALIGFAAGWLFARRSARRRSG